jgi:RecA-family ATPase
MTAMDCDIRTDLYRQQSKFVKDLEKIAQIYDVAIILVAHPKKSNTEFDNDTVSGSSDITNAVSFVWNYERGKDGEEDTGRIMVTKNRMNGNLIYGDKAIKVYYSGKSKRIAENPYEEKEYKCFELSDEEAARNESNELPF